jgi:hypothetical protein
MEKGNSRHPSGLAFSDNHRTDPFFLDRRRSIFLRGSGLGGRPRPFLRPPTTIITEREDRPELTAEILGEGLSQAIGSSDHVQKDMLQQHCPRGTVCILWVH